jgi:hypothetical protein
MPALLGGQPEGADAMGGIKSDVDAQTRPARHSGQQDERGERGGA